MDMENKTKTVLSSFTRKLANCRHTVSVKSLMKYFNEGKFGYTYDENEVEVVTNEYVFADDIATLVSHIRAIFKSPRMFLKKEYVIQNASVATNVDTETTRATYRDDKLWKLKGNGRIQPEYVHSFVNEDNYAVYENRFVCALIDKVFEIVSKKIIEISSELETLAGKVNGAGSSGFAPVDYADFAEGEGDLPCLIATQSPLVAVVESLIKSKKLLLMFKGRQLYLDCKKAGEFILHSVRPTNVLMFDATYNFCYSFYVNYLFREPNLANAQQQYYNFVVVNFLKGLEDIGCELVTEDAFIAITNSIKLRFDPIVYKKDPFTLTVELGENDQMLVSVAAEGQEVSAKYAFKVVSKTKAESGEIEDFLGVDAYARRINEVRDEGITQAFLVTEAGETDEGNAVYVSAELTDTQAKIKKLIKVCTIAAEGAKEIHSRYCPVCRSGLVGFDGDDYNCRACGTLYRIFPYNGKDVVWLKRMDRYEKPDEPIEITEEKEFKKDKSIRVKVSARRR